MTTAVQQRPLAWPLLETSLPWAASEEEDRRFSRLLRFGLAALAVSALVVSLAPVPELTREQAERVPPQLARVLLEKKALPEPPPKPAAKKPVKKPESKPEPKPEPKPQPKAEPVKPKPSEAPAARVELAREQARNSGLLQMQDQLQAMRETVDVAEVSGAQLASGESRAASVDRAVISDRARTRSGGVNASALSTDTGGSALASRETTVVESAAAGDAARLAGREVRRERSGRAESTIRSVMEANKGAIYAIYNRELRRDPTLQGKVTVKLVIEPNGVVSAVELVSSELASDELERKLLARIRLINFGAANVERTTLNYSIDFLPS